MKPASNGTGSIRSAMASCRWQSFDGHLPVRGRMTPRVPARSGVDGILGALGRNSRHDGLAHLALAAAGLRWLEGPAGMVLAVRQAWNLVAIAEVEVGRLRVADRPAAAGLGEHLERLALLHRNLDLLGGRHISFCVGLVEGAEGWVADGAEARLRSTLCRRPGRRAWACTMGFHARGRGTTGEPQSMHLADHGVARHASKPPGNLAGAQPFSPEPLELLDALIRPAHLVAPYRIRPHPLRGARTGTRAASSGAAKRERAQRGRHTAWPLQTLELGELETNSRQLGARGNPELSATNAHLRRGSAPCRQRFPRQARARLHRAISVYKA